MKRTASAQWTGDFKQGKGTISTQSTVLNNTPYSFKTRFEDGIGTNPEELIAGAHAGCFTMTVVVQLTQRGIIPEMLETQATVEVDMVNLKMTGIHLELKGKIEGISEEDFQTIAKDSKETCLVSKILNIPVTMSAILEN
jgi:lipoyl-dependent peroxiredoxin